jgi:hypothetical protein
MFKSTTDEKLLEGVKSRFEREKGFLWEGSGAKTLCFPMEGAQVRSLIGELDPTCQTKEFACHS